MKHFATKDSPLRASALPGFLACPLSLLLKQEQEMDGNAAAQTGSMIHKGVDAFHKLKSQDAACAVMAHAKGEYPLADTGKAVKHFQEYVRRQEAWGEVKASEQQITATLEAAGCDPTQEAIVIHGTLDQVRGCVVDIKTGSRLTPSEMFNEHAPQLAAYQLGWFQRTGEKLRAAIIRTQDFVTGGKAYHPCPWSFDDIYTILEPVRHKVAQVRLSLRLREPGSHCRFCPAGGIGNCLAGRTASVAPGVKPLPTVEELFS